ncbi:peptidase S41-like protein [Aquimarina sp. MAR_2010_214]|uniref:S41 family peptidase n=1 Tax=Aquimarina sp. MAR_2010_214 TaxID=1250026 RepID=UPI000C70BB0A|nr:S41 family peptidase [Aquimarina sp. MAR_2010_214]PKV51841.1 peptidase S41-like protein [Aquimarina sp. MAR_2010_214]
MKYIKYFALLLFVGNLFTSCFDDNDDVPRISGTTEINDFIWKGLNRYYLYKADVPDLANSRFPSNQEYTQFLEGFSTPKAFFEELKSKQTILVDGEQVNVDQFSWIVDDYVALEQAFDGITKNNGMEYGLVRYPNDQSLVFGYVRYVLPGTDAATKGIKRGDIFNTVNSTQINEQNFRQLLGLDSYTIGMATFDGTNVTSTGTSVSLTKVQYTENPVFISKTIDVGGSPVGYLMYNSFTADFDVQLNAAFGKFASDNVTDLILDLRYNGGGSVTSAIDLSSMITGQFNGQVFSTEQWNSDRQEQFGSTNLFDNQIRTGEAINNLNLSRVYILTTRSSASASELVINGLDPHVNVIQVGATTRGKFQASITLYDSDNFGRQGANTGHTYAMQPLVLKSSNSVGFTDYHGGFSPEIEIKEDYSNLGVLGDENEPLLKAAIDNILGTRSAKNYNTIQLESVGSSKMFSPAYQRMYK